MSRYAESTFAALIDRYQSKGRVLPMAERRPRPSVRAARSKQWLEALEQRVLLSNFTIALSGPSSGVEGSAIAVTATASDPENDPISLSWSVTKNGDAYASGSGGAINFTPNDNGSYVVNVTGADPNGGTVTTAHNVEIANAAPSLIVGGALDQTFGVGGTDGDGKVSVNFTGALETGREIITITQPDGRLLVVGEGSGNFMLASLNPDGSADTTFGTSGSATTATATNFNGSGRTEYNLGANDNAQAAVIDSQGRYVVAGISSLADTTTGAGGGTSNFALARFNPNGTIDTSFGVNGRVVTDFGGNEQATQIIVLNDGNLLVMGFDGFSTTRRYIAAVYDGQSGALLDSYLDARSNTTYSVGGITLDANGDAIAVGHLQAGLALMRYHWDSGAQQLTQTGFLFDNYLDATIGFEVGTGIAIDANGDLLVSANHSVVSNGPGDFMLARYSPSFTRLGYTYLNLGGDDDTNDLAITADGKILIGGRTTAADTSNFALARFNSDLSVDTSFGVGGFVHTNFTTNASGGSNDIGLAMTLQQANDTEYAVITGLTVAIGSVNGMFGVARYETTGTSPQIVQEGNTVHLRGQIADAGSADSFTLTVNWGPGADTTIHHFAAGTRFFDVSYTYGDDNPTATAIDLTTIQLSLSDDDGGVATAQTSLTVQNVEPTAAILDAPVQAFAGQAINLNSSVSDPGDDSFSYQWLVTLDGNTVASGSASSFSFTPTEPGAYEVALLVSDDDGGAAAQQTASIDVISADPVASISGDSTGVEGSAVNLVGGSDSNDPGTTLQWSVTKNGNAYASGSGSAISFTPDDDGSYVVTLTATNPYGGSGTATHTVEVANADPTAQITDVPVHTVLAKSPVTLNSAIGDPGSADTHSYQWTVTLDGDVVASGSGSSLTFTPAVIGQYQVALTVTDDDGGSVTSQATVVAISSSISGIVWEDFNNDGEVNFGEQGMAGVTVHLSGVDDLGQSISRTLVTDDDGAYVFLDLRPGQYTVSQDQPASHQDGQESLGTLGGAISNNDEFTLSLAANADGFNYNFGELPQAGAAVTGGQTASIGFWQNKHGQALIKSLNGGPTATQLGNWLAGTLPNLFGSSGQIANLSGASNATVASTFQSLFTLKGIKLDAQILATAMNVYVTTQSLAAQAAVAYGFSVSSSGLGYSTWNIGASGSALGVANNSTMTVMDILLAADDRYELWTTTSLRSSANSVFDGINSY